jgi:hypothetical protein
MVERPQKITFAEMRDSGMRGILVYCSDYVFSHFFRPAQRLHQAILQLPDKAVAKRNCEAVHDGTALVRLRWALPAPSLPQVVGWPPRLGLGLLTEAEATGFAKHSERGSSQGGQWHATTSSKA